MNCDGVRELLSAYVDGELSSGELLRVEQHLRRCPRCAEEVDALRQAIALVGALEEVELPAGFREGLRARLAKVSPQLQPVAPVAPVAPFWQRRVKRWALPAAAAAAFALAASGVYGQLGPILTRVADSQTPAGTVKTPSVNPAPPKPTEQNPGSVVAKDPETPTGPITDPGPGKDVPTPPVENSAGPDTGGKTPPDNPPTPPVIDSGASGMRVASWIEQVETPPEQLPSEIASRTTVEAIVPDPSASCNALKSTYTAAECAIKEAGRIVEVRFQVPAKQAAATLEQVTSVIGGAPTVKTDGIDRAPQLKAQVEQLITIDEDLDKLALAVDTAKDETQRAIEQEAYDRKADDQKKAVENYNRLSTEVMSQLFVVNLQKQGQ